MIRILILTGLLLTQFSSQAQTTTELLTKINAAQMRLKSADYTINRIDTFVTGDVRKQSGAVKLKTDPADKTFGFIFWAKRDDINNEIIYDGNSVTEINHDKKSFEVGTKQENFSHVTGRIGGQLVLTDLVRLDTAGVTRMEISEDQKNYYLVIHLKDLTEYDVTNRFKKLTISKLLMLPVGLKQHQETLGKIQDLNYIIKDIRINENAKQYDFSAQRFPDNYTAVAPVQNWVSPLKDKPSPDFKLKSFDGKDIQLDAQKGKVILLDFWEVWCGPCIAAMPKVDSLYEKFHSKGLEIYGVTNDTKQADAAKRFIQKRNISVPMLVGGEQIKKSYKVEGVPMYVVINRKGVVSFVSLGYSDKLENEIKKLL